MKLNNLWLILLAIVALLIPSTHVLAQDDDDIPENSLLIEIEGEVELIEDDEIVVDQIIIAPAGAFNPSILTVGDNVRITGYLLNDDTLQALSLVFILDADEDGIEDSEDNCPEIANPDQEDADEDGIGDDCDPDLLDTDQDGVVDAEDNCPEIANPDQEDADEDGIGDGCDPDLLDADQDGVVDAEDNCPEIANPDQEDADEDGIGDSCDPDDSDEDSEDSCQRDDHPIALALSDEFEVSYGTIIDWHCEGFGFGEISFALLLAENSESSSTAQDFLDEKAAGTGWGEIFREQGIDPSELAPGRVIGRANGRPENAGPPEDRGRPEDAGPPEDRGNGNNPNR